MLQVRDAVPRLDVEFRSTNFKPSLVGVCGGQIGGVVILVQGGVVVALPAVVDALRGGATVVLEIRQRFFDGVGILFGGWFGTQAAHSGRWGERRRRKRSSWGRVGGSATILRLWPTRVSDRREDFLFNPTFCNFMNHRHRTAHRHLNFSGSSFQYACYQG